MFPFVGSRKPQRFGFSAIALCAFVLATAAEPAIAAGCVLAPQGEGRVTAVTDARTLRLEDGRDVVLAGVEPVTADDATADKTKQTKARRIAALSAIVAGHDVTLHGDDDTPNRYGRQPALVFLAGSESSVQATLLTQGDALVAATVTDKDCAAELAGAEASAGTPDAESGPMTPS